MLRCKFVFLLCIASVIIGYGQSINMDKTVLANYLIRMYESSPFQGVKLVHDYNNEYLLSVVKLDTSKYKSDNELNRIASIKAMSQASRYINGSNIIDEIVIRTSEMSNGVTETETIEKIRENSNGYIRQLEHLTNFVHEKGKVFMFICPIAK